MKKIILGIGILFAFIFLFFFIVIGSKTINYISKSPFSCAVSCHLMEPATMEYVRSVHYKKAGCKSCHKDNLKGIGEKILKWYFLSPSFVENKVDIPKEICLKCHASRKDHMTDKCGICHTPSGIPHRWTVPHR